MVQIADALPTISADRLIGVRRPAGGSPRVASVLVLFAAGGRGPEVLLLERAADLRAHPGQVAFPGGGQDETDADAIATALREAEEETGLDPRGVDVVGNLPALWLAATDFLVTPVVGWWRDPVRVHPVDPAETASVHLVPVDDLLDPRNRGRVRHPSGYVGPAFRVGDVLVWGFTALVLCGLFRELGWGQTWDRGQYFELSPAVLAGSRRDLAGYPTAGHGSWSEEPRA